MKPNVVLLTDIADTQLGYGKYAGTYKIATEIRQSGFSCQVIDNYTFFGIDKLRVLLHKFIGDETVLLGISCTLNSKTQDGKTLFFGYDLYQFSTLLTQLKEQFPKLKVVVGGARITEHSSWPVVDYCVKGKGEVSIVALLNHLIHGSELKYHSHNNNKVLTEDDYPYTQEMFSTSIIQYEHNDIIFDNEAVPIEIARGCIFSCAYCKYDLIGKKIGEWTKTPETIRNEMIRNYEMFGTTHYNISDELINESLDKLKMVRDVIVSLPFKVSYTAYARIDLIWRYPEMRELFLESNAICLIFGIETLHDKAGKAIGKGLSPDKVKDTLRYCKEAWAGKILMCSNFIVGLPYEPKEHILETAEYLHSPENPLDIFTYSPLGLSFDEVSHYTGKSKIEIKPEKFGYNIIDNNTWHNTQMTNSEIIKLVNHLDYDPRMRRMHMFFQFKWIGRAISLGYDIETLFKMLDDENLRSYDVITTFMQRTQNIKNKYYDRLLALP